LAVPTSQVSDGPAEAYAGFPSRYFSHVT